MSTFDVVICTIVVGLAGAFLIFRMGFRRAPPACHPAPEAEPLVVVKGALAAGLERAQRRKKAMP